MAAVADFAIPIRRITARIALRLQVAIEDLC